MKKIGIIGLGSIGMRHANNLREMGYDVSGYDPLIDGRVDIGFVHTAKIEHLLAADAIVVASPTPLHAQHVTEAFLSGKPFFCEKPVADRLDITNLHHCISAITMVGYNLRFHSCVKRAKEWLDSGLIGTPLWANFTLGQFSEKPPYLRDGVILNWSHEIDLATYLLGPAKVAASSTRITRGFPDPITKLVNENDDMTDILLRHDGGCMSTVHLDYVTTPEQRHFTITGTKGRLFINVADRMGSLMVDGIWVDNIESAQTWNDTYIEEMQAFLDRCDGKETIGCTGKEGLEVLKICLEVRKQAGLE